MVSEPFRAYSSEYLLALSGHPRTSFYLSLSAWGGCVGDPTSTRDKDIGCRKKLRRNTINYIYILYNFTKTIIIMLLTNVIYLFLFTHFFKFILIHTIRNRFISWFSDFSCMQLRFKDEKNSSIDSYCEKVKLYYHKILTSIIWCINK